MHTYRNTIRPARLTQAVVLALLLNSGQALAQQSAPTGSAPGATVDYTAIKVDIAAQSTEMALDALAAQTGLQIVYPSKELVRGRTSPRVAGTYTVSQILDRLLSVNAMTYEFVNQKTVSIRSMTNEEWSARAEASIKETGSARPQEELETIVVTGSNLSNFSSASPVITLDAEQMQRRGMSSIEDVLRSLPQNLATRTSAALALNENEYGNNQLIGSTIGNTAINLRGLGSASTLVLVNGRRRTTSAQGMGAFTDISSIPLSQVEYIEVVTDGASAIYGADAVAGVVNIVLKKSFQGTTLQMRYENSSAKAHAARANIGHTFGWGSGTLTLMAGYERTKPSDLSRHVRTGPMGPGDFTSNGGVNMRRIAFGSPGGVFDLTDISGYYLVDAFLGYIPANQNGKTLKPADLTTAGATRSIYEYARVGPEAETKSVRAEGVQNIGANMELTFGVGYARQRNQDVWRPMLADFGPLTLVLNDRYNVTNYTLVSATNANNPFGRPVAVSYSYGREFDGMRLSTNQLQNNLDAHVGLKGKLSWLRNWNFSTSISYGGEDSTRDALQNFSGLSDPTRPEVAAFLEKVNPFGNGSDAATVAQNRALLEALIQRNQYMYNSRSLTWDGMVRGDLFSLPAGKVQMVLGAQYREEKNREQFLRRWGTAENSVGKFSRDSQAVFAELGIPLLKDKSFAKELTLSFAGRAERFKQGGSSTLSSTAYRYDPTTKIYTDLLKLGGFDLTKITGLTPGVLFASGPETWVDTSYSNVSPLARLRWKPFDDLVLRATWGKSFVTPTGKQLFGWVQAQDMTANFQWEGVPLPTGYQRVVQLLGSNSNLKPQTATTLTYGFDYSPRFIPGLLLSMTYNRIKFNNYIGAPFEELKLAQFFAPNVLSQLPAGMVVPGQNGVLLLDARNFNFAGRTSKSIDFGASYGTSNAWGDWRLDLNVSRMLELSIQPSTGAPKVVLSNTEYGPSKWASDLTISWDKGNFNAAFGGHYTSGFNVMRPYSATKNLYNNYVANPNPRTHAGGYLTFDGQVGYKAPSGPNWLSGLGVQLGVQNMFDRKFSFVDNNNGFVSNRSGIRGRVIYMDLKKEF